MDFLVFLFALSLAQGYAKVASVASEQVLNAEIMDTLSALTQKSIKQEIELSALTEKSTKQEIEISFLKEEIDVLKKTSVMQNAKTSALVEASSTGDPVDDLEERVSENEKNLKELWSELEEVYNEALTGIDEVQEELNEYKDSATAVCGYKIWHDD